MTVATHWRCGPHTFTLTEDFPLVMGILNVTPDSFSDGGTHNTLEAALAHARKMRDEGAHIVDVGGESTRPGFDEFGVSLEEERRRVLPVVKALVAEGFCVSVDTSKPEIMTEAAAAGAAILNDIRGFERPGALEAAAKTECGLVVMHRKAEPVYEDVVTEVLGYLEERSAKLEALGVSPDRICWDPGFGFGKTPDGNFALLGATQTFVERGYPFMTALSRKSSIGLATGQERPLDRVAGSVAGALFGAHYGSAVLRVHDVRETADALAVWRSAMRGALVKKNPTE